jgi:hypothetical protein
LLVDSQGFALGILVTEGNASERLGAATVIFYHQQEFSATELIWVDEGYSKILLGRCENPSAGSGQRFVELVWKSLSA